MQLLDNLINLLTSSDLAFLFTFLFIELSVKLVQPVLLLLVDVNKFSNLRLFSIDFKINQLLLFLQTFNPFLVNPLQILSEFLKFYAFFIRIVFQESIKHTVREIQVEDHVLLFQLFFLQLGNSFVFPVESSLLDSNCHLCLLLRVLLLDVSKLFLKFLVKLSFLVL